jgi:mycothiol synthase
VNVPKGFTVRAAVPDDLETAAALVRAEEESLRGESHFRGDDLRDYWRLADFDGGSWVVERERAPVAYVACIHREGRAECWASVHPHWNGHGLGTFLLQRAEGEALRQKARELRAGMFAENDAARALFAALDYTEVRHYFQMRIDLDVEPPSPRWPNGLAPTIFRPDDARDFHAALNEAFADEWGWHPAPFEEWQRYRLEDPTTDTSLWFIVRDGDHIAAVARCEDNRDDGGWIGAIGVLEPWRRRGLGLALLQHAFGEFYRRGVPHVGLGVDADNPTNATRLYEKAGMRVLKEDVIFEKELA